MTTDEMLAELKQVAQLLADHVERATALYDRRAVLILALRDADPPVTMPRIAAAAGITCAAATNVEHKRRARQPQP